MTLLTWNNNTGKYEAQVDGVGLIEVDGDTYAEDRYEMMKGLMTDRKLGDDLDALSEEVYNALYDEAVHELEQAEAWLAPPMTGLSINGISQE